MNDNGGYQRDKADAAERLLNITLALISTRIGMTKSELFSAIRDYRNDIEAGISLKSLEKKFERDKDDLRASGIQLETTILQSDMGDNQETRYIINPSGFQWPKDVTLSPKQLQLLQLASTVWRQASLSSDAARGLDRLRALGSVSPSSDLIGFAPRIKTHEPAFVPLTNAVTDRHQVSFENHPNEECHDRYVGACVSMVLAGQPEKAVVLYNRWARFSGYAPITLVSRSPILIDIKTALLLVENDNFKVIQCRPPQQ